jgi:pimeloyl-ACP methyl ester carboxylesterase
MQQTAAVSLDRRCTGSGSPIVLVHGTACDGESLRLLETILADEFSVVTVDRRGRRNSGDADVYTVQGEFDDVAAVIDELNEPAVLFGHSFGANVALGAASRTVNLKSLVLYEPGRPGDIRPQLRDEISRLISVDDRVAAMRLALGEFTRLSEEWLDELLATPPWRARLDYAHTIARELNAYDELDYGDLSRLKTPTLFLVGSESTPADLAYAHAIACRMPSARVSVLHGQGHLAATTAPTLLAREIAGFAHFAGRRLGAS